MLLGRVSRGERQQDPEAQLEPLRAAVARLGWVVAAEVKLTMSAWDAGAAAEVRRRCYEPIVAGVADTLCVWAWDRFSREGIEGAFAELRHLETHLGAALWSLQEPFLSTAAGDRQQRELMLAIIAWAAKWESSRRSERTLAKLELKRGRGGIGVRERWAAGKLASADDVRQVRELAAAGWSVRAIAAELQLSKSQVSRLLPSGRPEPTVELKRGGLFRRGEGRVTRPTVPTQPAGQIPGTEAGGRRRKGGPSGHPRSWLTR